ncbi:MAG TPA: GNAT family N-acetyltransferase [Candidatus Acidoferrum sp.]|nr:GNAT family N-acetyltransferase [Candidatus Acidoferrum sp.]
MSEIRRATEADAQELARLRVASLIEQGHLRDADPRPFELRAVDDFARLFREGRLVAWVLRSDDAIVGSACAIYFERLPFPDGTLHAELSGVYVAPSHRGAGCASRLVMAVVEEVRASRVRRTFLRPSPGARSLYARLGFVDDTAGIMALTTS